MKAYSPNKHLTLEKYEQTHKCTNICTTRQKLLQNLKIIQHKEVSSLMDQSFLSLSMFDHTQGEAA